MACRYTVRKQSIISTGFSYNRKLPHYVELGPIVCKLSKVSDKGKVRKVAGPKPLIPTFFLSHMPFREWGSDSTAGSRVPYYLMRLSTLHPRMGKLFYTYSRVYVRPSQMRVPNAATGAAVRYCCRSQKLYTYLGISEERLIRVFNLSS